MNAEQIRAALRKRYNDTRRYAIAEEVGLTTGFSHRRLDMMVLDCYFSNGFRIDGFEIKVSTADLRRELEDPEKHVAFFNVIDYYTIAVPAGVVDPLMEVIPKKWGILIVNEDGSTRMKRKPLALEDKKADKAIPRGFFASITRAIQARQPSAQELQQAYDRGCQEAEERIKRERKYLDERVSREAEKLRAYDELQRRFRIFGDDVEKAMDEFEAFRKMDLKWVCVNLKNSIEQLSKMKMILEEKSNGEAALKEVSP